MSLRRRALPRLATSPYVGPSIETFGPGRNGVFSVGAGNANRFVVGTTQCNGPVGGVERERRVR